VKQGQPIINAPGVVVCLLAIFVGVHLVRSFIPESQDAWLIELLAFVPARLSPGGAEFYGGEAAVYTQFVTHMFLHGDLTHLIVNSAWFLAFGTSVARRTGGMRFLAFFLICGICGALFYLAWNPGMRNPMIGASGAISGLMGASFRFLFGALHSADPDAIAGESYQPPLLSLRDTLTDRRLLSFILGWTGLNILFAWGAAELADGMNIAWEAHLGGFYAGLLLFGWFDRQPAVHQNVASAE
jgi:membrane associated rhomboid family serine protease